MIVPTATLRAGQIRYPHSENGGSQVVTLTPQQIAGHGPKLHAKRNLPLGAGRQPKFACRIQQISAA